MLKRSALLLVQAVAVAVAVIKSSNDIILRPIDFLWPMSSNWSIFVFNKIYCDPLLNGWSSQPHTAPTGNCWTQQENKYKVSDPSPRSHGSAGVGGLGPCVRQEDGLCEESSSNLVISDSGLEQEECGAGGEMTRAATEPSRSLKLYNRQGLILVESISNLRIWMPSYILLLLIDNMINKWVLTHSKQVWEGSGLDSLVS